MPSQVLWTIDSEMEAKAFERLCVDLLYRKGYKDIVPVQPQDGGRDAEEHPRQGRGPASEAAFFQFSMEKDWKAKLRRDARTLHEAKFEFSILVFVTTRDTRGVDVDALTKEFRGAYGWALKVYGREWLRFQLEEDNPDLAKKYLDIEIPDWASRPNARMNFNRPSDARLEDAWRAFKAEQFERAAVEFNDFLVENVDSSGAVWLALAWAQYRSHRYDEALASINQSLSAKQTAQARAVRACILVEKGIRDRDRLSLLEGRNAFDQALTDAPQDWQLRYNLGNAESALGNHSKSIELYRQALGSQPNEPEVWKNLASAYHLVGDHEAEMKCFDEVLRIDPDKVEALVSKGTSLMVDLGRPEEAVPLLERALASNPGWAVRWPHIWYWAAEAQRRCGRPQAALAHVEAGLAHQPGHPAMRRLKSALLAELTESLPVIVDDARQYWRSGIRDSPHDYVTRERLARLEMKAGNDAAAWALADECFEVAEIGPVIPIRGAGFELDRVLTALRSLPQYAAFRKRLSVADYWNTEDPRYDLDFEPPVSEQGRAALLAYLAVPFGLALQLFESEEGDRSSRATLVRLTEFVRPLIEQAIVQAARSFAPLIPPRSAGVDSVAEVVANLLRFLGLIAIREFPRQRAWIASQFQITRAALEAGFRGYDNGDILKVVASRSILVLNEEARFIDTDSTDSAPTTPNANK